jgi:phage host-nuclease inhibitor protein Gam
MVKTMKASAQKLVPTSRQAAVEQARQIQKTELAIEKLEMDRDDNIAQLKADCETATDPLKRHLKELQKGLQTFCDANRPTLTQNGKIKSHNFGAARVYWRISPPAVRVSGGVDALIERLRKDDDHTKKYLRTKFELNKPGILADHEAAAKIEGISITKEKEVFTVETVREPEEK